MLKVLSEDSYQATLAEIDLGQIGATKKASILWDDGVARSSYVKVYQPEERCRKLCNEAIGFILGNSLGLLQPTQAALMPIPEFIKSEFDLISDIYSENQVWAWVTTECGDSLKAQFRVKSNPLPHEKEQNNIFLYECLNFLAKKEGLPPIIAFDDYIGNNDRNIGNLVITLDGSIGIIDHGEVLGRIDWLKYLTYLCDDEYFNNVLLKIVDDFSPSKFQIRGASVLASKEHTLAFKNSKDDLEYWLRVLLQLSKKDTLFQEKCLLRLLKYLSVRSLEPSESFAQRIGLVA